MRISNRAVWLASLVPVALTTASCRDFDYYDDDPGDIATCVAPEPEADVIESCNDAIPAASEGTCSIEPGTGNRVVIRGDVLGTDTIYENGSVLIDGKQIICVGCDCAGQNGYAEATFINCADAVISPGLINAHDHLTFNEAAPIDIGETRYEHRHEWRAELATPSNAHGRGSDSTGMRWVEMRQVMAGTTTVAGSGRANGMMRNIDRLNNDDPGRCINLARCLGEVEFETFPLGDSNRVPHSDCGWDYEHSELEVASYSAYLPHVAEGIDDLAQEEFRCQSSSFDGAKDHTAKNTAHIHGVGLHTVDYYNMARDGAQLIWSPRTNISLYGNTAQVTTFAGLGGTIALGTDWSYSGSVNMLRELACADEWNEFYLNSYFTSKELWEMATIGSAVAIGGENLLGTLAANRFADVAVFAKRDRDSYRAVIEAGNADVALVMRAGEILYGDAAVVTALDDTCETLDVCGESRAICAMSQFGATFTSIDDDANTAPAAYPLVFCGLPDGEPTCAPSRPGEYTGLPGELDGDGDGVLDDVDNCACLFNPIRPIDGAGQPDLDGDGLGDVCDPDPLDPDLDGDQVANLEDNCPFRPNDDQSDLDEDGRGDTCDLCPGEANPDSPCTVFRIEDIQRGVIAEGTRVTVQGVVTGENSNTFMIQDPNASSPAFSGIFVFAGQDYGLALGTIVEVEGTIDEFFGVTELTDNTVVTVLGSGTPIEPVELSVDEAALEDYEGVLVKITSGVTSVDTNYDCTMDDPGCSDDDLWRYNGSTGNVVAYDLFYGQSSSEWLTHEGEQPVTGVMHYRRNSRRILPRTPADFGP